MADVSATEDFEDEFMMENTSSSDSFVSAVEVRATLPVMLQILEADLLLIIKNILLAIFVLKNILQFDY